MSKVAKSIIFVLKSFLGNFFLVTLLKIEVASSSFKPISLQLSDAKLDVTMHFETCYEVAKCVLALVTLVPFQVKPFYQNNDRMF